MGRVERAAVYAGGGRAVSSVPDAVARRRHDHRPGSLALLDEETVAGEVRTTSAEGHSRWLLPAIESLLASQGWGLEDLDGFAVTVGPGSFTGIRVGIRPGSATVWTSLASDFQEETNTVTGLVRALLPLRPLQRLSEGGRAAPGGERAASPIQPRSSSVSRKRTDVVEKIVHLGERQRVPRPHGRTPSDLPANSRLPAVSSSRHFTSRTACRPP